MSGIMSGNKYKAGDILRHKLSKEMIIVVQVLYWEKLHYKIRRPDYSLTEVMEEELEECPGY